MESMRNRVRRATSQGTGAAPPATPLGASQETCNKDRELGRAFCPRCLSLVPRAHRRHTPHLARLLPCGIPRRIRTEATRHPGHDVRGLWRSCRGARPQARDQRRPGDGTRGAQTSVHAGEPPLALQLVSPPQDRLDRRLARFLSACSLDWRGARRAWRLNRTWAGAFLAPLGIVDAGRHAEPLEDVRTAA